MYQWFTSDLPVIYECFTHELPVIYLWFTRELLVIYLWFNKLRGAGYQGNRGMLRTACAAPAAPILELVQAHLQSPSGRVKTVEGWNSERVPEQVKGDLPLNYQWFTSLLRVIYLWFTSDLQVIDQWITCELTELLIHYLWITCELPVIY